MDVLCFEAPAPGGPGTPPARGSGLRPAPEPLVNAPWPVVVLTAGIVLASRITSGQPNTSQGFELEVISACVLGGVSLSGGVARISAVIAGVLIMGVVQNAMSLLNIAPGYQYVARGVILLAAVLFDRWKRRRA